MMLIVRIHQLTFNFIFFIPLSNLHYEKVTELSALHYNNFERDKIQSDKNGFVASNKKLFLKCLIRCGMSKSFLETRLS